MNANRRLYNQPVRSLQWMLRTIAQHEGDGELPVPNGIYDSRTQAAVARFQHKHGLPVTGVADLRTWEEIVRAYDHAVIALDAPHPILSDRQTVLPPEPGEYSPHLHLAQSMMHFLAEEYHSILCPAQTGHMDEVTRHALADFQQLAGLPMTERLDKHTWHHLVLHYSNAVAKR